MVELIYISISNTTENGYVKNLLLPKKTFISVSKIFLLIQVVMC